MAASVFFLKSTIRQLFHNLVMTYYFFLLDTLFDGYKGQIDCLWICRQLSGFLNNSIRVYPIKLKISMLLITWKILFEAPFFRYVCSGEKTLWIYNIEITAIFPSPLNQPKPAQLPTKKIALFILFSETIT